MNILLVSPLPPPLGGIASWTKAYMKFAEEHNINVFLVDSAIKGQRVNNINSISIVDEIKRSWNIRKNIKKNLLEKNIDIIHYNASCSTMGLIRDTLILQSLGVKIVYQCHCNLNDALGNKLSRLFFKIISNIVDKILVLNSESLKIAKEYKNNAEYIPNFISTIYCEAINLRNSVTSICFVGRVVPSKGIYELIKAAESFKNIEFHIIGPVDKEIENRILRNNVKIWGPQSNRWVIDFLKTTDIYILPSYSEGFPLGVLEAMSCGIPIIATNVGSIDDMIGQSGGILIRQGSYEDIIKAIHAMENKKVREKMAEYNLNKIKEEYVIEVVMEKIFNLYKKELI